MIKISKKSGEIRVTNQDKENSQVEFTKNILSRTTSEFSVNLELNELSNITIQVSCGCTKATYDKGVVDVKFSPKVLGTTVNRITVFGNNPSGEKVKHVIKVKANVI